MMATVRWLVVSVLNLYSMILLARVIASWIDPLAYSPISRWLVRLTEPLLAPIRRLLPRTGPVDLSPLILFLLLVLLSRLVWAIF